ncbi:hypothetical protein TSUD_89890 [Trifolium subterraneum]|uniref:non-specific serine/threonine protein kinase n=1 Tax=Trifolium subterraneum TaxID=3900 RepID=A0A2Z6P7T4_TRISU|nr:hypothetical protein TSUD_89890 [Trifolium subterraneum]
MSESTATSTSLMSLKVLVLAAIFLIIVIIIVLLIFLCFRSNRSNKKRKLLPKLHSSGTTPLVSKEIAVISKEIDLTRSTEQTRIQILDDVVGEKKEAEIKVEIRKGDVLGGGVHMEEDPNIGWGRWYSLKEVEMATRGFAEGNVIGEGGYGVVYRGVLQDSVVAVKNLHNNKGQAEKEFKVEVEAIGKVRHKNLVRLVGYCAEGARRMLVYEYVENGNLEQWLHGNVGPVSPLMWDIRMKIAIGTAKGCMNLVDWFKGKVASRRSDDLVDPLIEIPPCPRSLKRVLLVCLRCIDLDVIKRPKMGQIVHMLESDDFPFRSELRTIRDKDSVPSQADVSIKVPCQRKLAEPAEKSTHR